MRGDTMDLKVVLDQIKDTVSSEIRIVSAVISGIKDNIQSLCVKIDDIKKQHDDCKRQGDSEHQRLNNEIHDIQVKLAHLEHADIDHKQFQQLSKEVTELKEKCSFLMKIIYGLGAAVASMLLKMLAEFIQKV